MYGKYKNYNGIFVLMIEGWLNNLRIALITELHMYAVLSFTPCKTQRKNYNPYECGYQFSGTRPYN